MTADSPSVRNTLGQQPAREITSGLPSPLRGNAPDEIPPPAGEQPQAGRQMSKIPAHTFPQPKAQKSNRLGRTPIDLGPPPSSAGTFGNLHEVQIALDSQ